MKKVGYLVLGSAIWMVTGCGSDVIASEEVPRPAKVQHHKKYKTTGWSQTGIASFYGPEWHGRLTANGERLNIHAMTAAHKTLKFGTRVRVTNLQNSKTIIVRINDRGPFVRGRIIDLTDGAARRIGITPKVGIVRVRIEKIRN
jgi:rare lipoprotein A